MPSNPADLATNVENIFATSDLSATSTEKAALDLTLRIAVGAEWNTMNNELAGGSVPNPSVWNNLSNSNNPLTKDQFNGGHFVLSNISLADIQSDLQGEYGQFLRDFGGGVHGKYQRAVSGGAAQHGDWLHSHIYTSGARGGTANLSR